MGARRVLCLYLMKITLKPKELKRMKAMFFKREKYLDYIKKPLPKVIFSILYNERNV